MISGMRETSLNAVYSHGKVCKEGVGNTSGGLWSFWGILGVMDGIRRGFLAPRHKVIGCVV